MTGTSEASRGGAASARAATCKREGPSYVVVRARLQRAAEPTENTVDRGASGFCVITVVDVDRFICGFWSVGSRGLPRGARFEHPSLQKLLESSGSSEEFQLESGTIDDDAKQHGGPPRGGGRGGD